MFGIKVLLFFLSFSAYSQCYKQPQTHNILKCPKSSAKVNLGNIHAAAGIFLGLEQHGDSDNSAYLTSFIDILQKNVPQIQINLVIPREVIEGKKTPGLENILSQFGKTLNIIPIKEPMPSWIQDPMEFYFDISNKKVGVQGLPYSRSENIYQNISEACNIESTKTPEVFGYGGNHGGNIEPLYSNVIMMGDTSSKLLRSYFEKQGMQVITVSTSWLNVGHVDETLLPLPSNSNCPLNLGYASPIKALELLADWKEGDGCTKKLMKRLKGIGFPKKKDCLSLVKSSQTYENIIMADLVKIKRGQNCIKEIPFPVIFFAENLHRKKYGTVKDKAKSIFPNPINSLVLGGFILTPWQRIPEFESYIKETLSREGLAPHFIKNKTIHWNGGNVHCTSNVIRVCQ